MATPIFNPLLGVWKSNEKLFLLFDILHPSLVHVYFMRHWIEEGNQNKIA